MRRMKTVRVEKIEEIVDMMKAWNDKLSERPTEF